MLRDSVERVKVVRAWGVIKRVEVAGVSIVGDEGAIVSGAGVEGGGVDGARDVGTYIAVVGFREPA